MLEQRNRIQPEIEVIDSLDQLRGIYATHAIDEAIKNAEFLANMHISWGEALDYAAIELGVEYEDPDQLPYLLEAETSRRAAEKATMGPHATKTVLGLAGPGATGKGTVTQLLDVPKVINTTTRAPRDYETDGIDYHFVDEQEFAAMAEAGHFVSVTERPGRGNYGIQARDLEKTLSTSDTTIVEENPATLAKVTKNITTLSDTGAVAAYVLPPSPIIAHLATRLAGRCLVAGENYRRVLDSTLGERQVEEFRSFVPLATNGARALFVVNDIPERAVNVIKSAVSAGKR